MLPKCPETIDIAMVQVKDWVKACDSYVKKKTVNYEKRKTYTGSIIITLK